MRKKIVCLILLIFIFACKTGTEVGIDNSPAPEAKAYTARLTQQEALDDIDYILQIVREVHPVAEEGLPEVMVVESNRIKALILEEGVEIYRFHFYVNAILATLNDGHTFAFPRYKEDLLNLPCVWTFNGLVATEDTDYGLRRGDIIRSIGPRSVERIISFITPYISSENKYWVRVRSLSYFYRKSFLLGHDLVKDGEELVQIGVERPKGVSTVFANFITEENSTMEAEQRPFCGYSVYKDELGVFYLDSCNNNDLYKETLKEFFSMVKEKNIKRIALDLRENTGGNSQVIDEFLNYFPEKRIKTFGGYRRFSVHTKNRGLSPRSSGNSYFPATTKVVGGAQPLFDGKLFCLISNTTFSSANWFAEIIQANKIGLLVGEPTGNAPDSYGNIMSFVAPASGLGFTVSWCRWESPRFGTPGYEPRDAVYPDLEVRYLSRDYLEGSDPLLEKALLYN
ncbi:MAG: hypothetical protein JXR63_00930 [Spirochaetales bacterium]|nr:hypothetical protein [Spirochaetales bacterium]